MVLISTQVRSEYLPLSCDLGSGPLIIEFDESKQLVRFDGNNKHVYKSEISPGFIKWSVNDGVNEVQNYSINRYNGEFKYHWTHRNDVGKCVVPKKKF